MAAQPHVLGTTGIRAPFAPQPTDFDPDPPGREMIYHGEVWSNALFRASGGCARGLTKCLAGMVPSRSGRKQQI
jgi:hypothetical protein